MDVWAVDKSRGVFCPIHLLLHSRTLSAFLPLRICSDDCRNGYSLQITFFRLEDFIADLTQGHTGESALFLFHIRWRIHRPPWKNQRVEVVFITLADEAGGNLQKLYGHRKRNLVRFEIYQQTCQSGIRQESKMKSIFFLAQCLPSI